MLEALILALFSGFWRILLSCTVNILEVSQKEVRKSGHFGSKMGYFGRLFGYMFEKRSKRMPILTKECQVGLKRLSQKGVKNWPFWSGAGFGPSGVGFGFSPVFGGLFLRPF